MAQAIAVQPGIYICLCSGARGEFFCIECEQYFCKTCRISHKKASVSKSHQLVEVIETESKECEMCLTKYAGQFFCVDCGQYFCRNCKTSHLRANVSKNHVFRDSADLETSDTSKYVPESVELAKKKKGDVKNKKDSNKHENKSVDCEICLEEIPDNNKKILHRCKHEFCKECIDECFRHRPVCPICGMVYGIVIGTQPPGTMKVEHRPHFPLEGYKKQGCWVINYTFYSGKQTAEQPDPGKPYRGTSRTAYLPADEKGTMVMKLLKIAFDRKLVFAIGHSRTTGEENVVTWNGITHKTSMGGGPQAFGYPDPDYLDRVLHELAAVGVTKDDLDE